MNSVVTKIDKGGKLSDLESELSEIKVNSGGNYKCELWLVDKTGNQSLTYLNLLELLSLRDNLNKVLNDIVFEKE